ncbi:MAG: hypothetical protein QW703_00890, partial [Candidatus Aenigmatarchaeota archaeon]
MNKKKKHIILYTNREILSLVKEEKPDLIAIDAPFGFPKRGWWRDSDVALIKAGFRPLSPKLPSMQPLVRRVMKLLQSLKGYKVIEVFPRATEKVLKLKKPAKMNQHVYDAMLCALTGKYYLEGRYKAIG